MDNKLGKVVASLIADFAKIKSKVDLLTKMRAVTKDGIDGKDGKDAEPVDLAAIVTDILAKIPPSKDGSDGKDGRDGRDGVSPSMTDIVNTALSKIPPPKAGRDGVSPDMSDIVNRVLSEVLAQMPVQQAVKALNGDKGDKGDRGVKGVKGDPGDSITKIKLEKNNDIVVWIGATKHVIGRVTIPISGMDSFTPGAAAGGGGGPTPTLQKVTGKGNITNKNIIMDGSRIFFNDVEGTQKGLIRINESGFGMVIAGVDKDALGQTVTIGGSTLVLAGEQIGAIFNGAEEGNTLILGPKFNIDGNDAFILNSIPVDYVEFSEQFTNPNDVVLTDIFQSVLSTDIASEGPLANTYLAGSSSASGIFRLINSANTSIRVEYFITNNGAPVGPGDLFFADVPGKNQGVDGQHVVSYSDTSFTNVIPGDDITLEIRQLTGSGIVVAGTITVTTLIMTQYASLQNPVQSLEELTVNSTLVENRYYRLMSGSEFTLPSASSRFNGFEPFALFVKNATVNEIKLVTSVGDLITTINGDQNSIILAPGESVLLLASSTSTYDIMVSYANEGTDQYAFIRSGILNNNAFLKFGDLQTTPNIGPNPRYESLLTHITWSESAGDPGTLEIFSNNSLIGVATKTAIQKGTAIIVSTSTVQPTGNISVKWVADNSPDMLSNPSIIVYARRHYG